jgi:hypothetical protein
LRRHRHRISTLLMALALVFAIVVFLAVAALKALLWGIGHVVAAYRRRVAWRAEMARPVESRAAEWLGL